MITPSRQSDISINIIRLDIGRVVLKPHAQNDGISTTIRCMLRETIQVPNNPIIFLGPIITLWETYEHASIITRFVKYFVNIGLRGISKAIEKPVVVS